MIKLIFYDFLQRNCPATRPVWTSNSIGKEHRINMNKREIVKVALAGSPPPYTPWSFRFTVEAEEALCRHYGCEREALIEHTGCHILELGSPIGFFEDLGNDLHKDIFGVVWDRSKDKDIGMPNHLLLEAPEDLENLSFPDPRDPRFLRTSKGASRGTATVSVSSPWGFLSLSALGPCVAWKTS
jgi:hypothetical protein